MSADVMSSYIEAEKKGWGKTEEEAVREARQNAEAYVEGVKESNPSMWNVSITYRVSNLNKYRVSATALIKMRREV